MSVKYNLDEIVEDYKNGLSIPLIVSKHGCWENTVRSVLKKRGVFHDRYFETLNHNFFETITSEKQAYWLGFLTADGCVFKNRLRLELKNTDFEHLEKFKKDLEIKNKINFFSRKTNYLDLQLTCSIQCSSPKMISDLSKLYVVQNKTGKTQMPSIPESLIRHYFRGVVDGDGSMYTSNGSVFLELTGDFDILSQFSRYCNSIVSHKSNLGKHENCFRFRLSKNKAIKIINHLYFPSSVYLNRKMDFAKSISQLG